MNVKDYHLHRVRKLTENADKHHYDKLRHNKIIVQNGLTAAQDSDGELIYEKTDNPMMFDDGGVQMVLAFKPKVGTDIKPKVYTAREWFAMEIEKSNKILKSLP